MTVLRMLECIGTGSVPILTAMARLCMRSDMTIQGQMLLLFEQRIFGKTRRLPYTVFHRLPVQWSLYIWMEGISREQRCLMAGWQAWDDAASRRPSQFQSGWAWWVDGSWAWRPRSLGMVVEGPTPLLKLQQSLRSTLPSPTSSTFFSIYHPGLNNPIGWFVFIEELEKSKAAQDSSQQQLVTPPKGWLRSCLDHQRPTNCPCTND